MKVTDLKEDEGILCRTQNEAATILKLLPDFGLDWPFGLGAFREGGMVLYPYEKQFGNGHFALGIGHKIFPASLFLQPEPEAQASEWPRWMKVWDNNEAIATKTIVLTRLPGITRYPYVCVEYARLDDYNSGREYAIECFKNAAPLNPDVVLVTLSPTEAERMIKDATGQTVKITGE